MFGWICTLGILMYLWAQSTGKGLECQGLVHLNGSTSYHLSGVLSSGNCSIEWSMNKKVIAFKDENEDARKDDDLVEALTARVLTTKACQENVLYKEDCPALGASRRVPCSCNCSKAGSHHSFNESMELTTFEGQGRSYWTTLIVFLVFFFVCLLISYRYKKIIKGKHSGGQREGQVFVPFKEPETNGSCSNALKPQVINQE